MFLNIPSSLEKLQYVDALPLSRQVYVLYRGSPLTTLSPNEKFISVEIWQKSVAREIVQKTGTK
jgi:hypothetical protein